METFADYILNEQDYMKKLEIVYYLQKRTDIFFDNSVILKTEIASQVNIKIMRAFVLIRKYISTNLLEQKYINNQVIKNTKDIKSLKESFKEFDKNKKLNKI